MTTDQNGTTKLPPPVTDDDYQLLQCVDSQAEVETMLGGLRQFDLQEG